MNELIEQLQDTYEGADVELSTEGGPPIVYIHFNNGLDYSLAILDEKKSKICIIAFAGFRTKEYAAETVFEKKVRCKDMDQLLDHIYSAAEELQEKELAYHMENEGLLEDWGTKAADNERLFGPYKTMKLEK